MNKIKLLPCPICDRKVKVRGGIEEWTPTFYDPDSGGDPYYINCECGLYFSIGDCDTSDLIRAWNTRKPMEYIEGQLKTELKLTDRKMRRCRALLASQPQLDKVEGYEEGIRNALDIVRKGGVDNAE